MTHKKYRRKPLRYTGFFRDRNYPDIIMKVSGETIIYHGNTTFRFLEPRSLKAIHRLICSGRWVQIPLAEVALII